MLHCFKRKRRRNYREDQVHNQVNYCAPQNNTFIASPTGGYQYQMVKNWNAVSEITTKNAKEMKRRKKKHEKSQSEYRMLSSTCSSSKVSSQYDIHMSNISEDVVKETENFIDYYYSHTGAQNPYRKAAIARNIQLNKTSSTISNHTQSTSTNVYEKMSELSQDSGLELLGRHNKFRTARRSCKSQEDRLNSSHLLSNTTSTSFLNDQSATISCCDDESLCLVTAGRNYYSDIPNHLSVRQGELLTLYENNSHQSNMLLVENYAGCRGYVPSTVIQNMPHKNKTQYPSINDITSHPTLVVAFDYLSETERDISLQANERVFLLNANDSDWFLIKKLSNGMEGYVPAIFLVTDPEGIPAIQIYTKNKVKPKETISHKNTKT